MRIGVVSVQVPFVFGGAEIHSVNLVDQLRLRGHEAELITFPFKWYPPSEIVNSIAISRMIDLTESNGKKIDRIIGLKFPAYLIPHHNKVLWILHQHRTAYDLWDHPTFGDLINFPDGRSVRDIIHHSDRSFIPESKAIFSNSSNISERLWKFNRISSQILYHPPSNQNLFYHNEPSEYLYFPSRITKLKRQDLVISALAACREPVRIVFSGEPESAEYMDELRSSVCRNKLDERISWLGFVSESEKYKLYAECLAVIYPPIDEDYGYITLEAMLSNKAVITTSDSGGPLEFVIPGETGLVATPEAISLAAIMDEAWRNRHRTIAMGHAARNHYESMGISWDNAIEALTS